MSSRMDLDFGGMRGSGVADGRQRGVEFHGKDNSHRLPRAAEITALVAATEPPFSMNAPAQPEDVSFSLV